MHILTWIFLQRQATL